MKIEVNQDHINKGEKRDILWCPVARAIRDHFPIKSIGVSYLHINIGPYGFTIPEDVRKFIEDFDEHGPSYVRPFSFELPIGLFWGD